MTNNLPIISDLVDVKYFAAGERLEPNACGLVCRDKLIVPDRIDIEAWIEDNYDGPVSDWYNEDDAFSPPAGWTDVYIDGRYAGFVDDDNLWIEVTEEPSLVGGWGASCPTGGTTAWNAPTHVTDDGRYISKHVWG